MKNKIGLLIVCALILGTILLARNNTAWAGTAGDAVSLESQAQIDPSAQLGNTEKGTVKPPPSETKFCESGLYSVGGVATFNVHSLAPGYCLEAFLHNKNFALGRIPEGAGSILANVTFLRVYYHGRFVYEVPSEDGDIEICFAVPPDKQAQIYFYNHYGPRFGKGNGQPSWEPLQTTVEDGLACATAQTSGAYALIGQ
jgi:hypothetical protein